MRRPRPQLGLRRGAGCSDSSGAIPVAYGLRLVAGSRPGRQRWSGTRAAEAGDRQRGIEMRVVTDDGVGLEVVERGSGPTLLLVHGFGGAKEDFADHARRARGAPSRRHVRPPRSRRERFAAAIPSDVLARPHGGRHARRRGRGRRGPVPAPRPLDGRDGRPPASCSRIRSGSRRSILMDTSPGPVPGIDGEMLEMGAVIALERGHDRAEADHGRVRSRSARPRTSARWPSGRATRSSTTGSGRRSRR